MPLNHILWLSSPRRHSGRGWTGEDYSEGSSSGPGPEAALRKRLGLCTEGRTWADVPTRAWPLAMRALPQPGTCCIGSSSPSPSAPLCRATRTADLVTCNEDARRPENRIIASVCSSNIHCFISRLIPPTVVMLFSAEWMKSILSTTVGLTLGENISQ